MGSHYVYCIVRNDFSNEALLIKLTDIKLSLASLTPGEKKLGLTSPSASFAT